MAKTLQEITDYLTQSLPAYYEITLQGDGTRLIQDIRPLKSAKAGDISFLTSDAYQTELASTQASALLMGKNHTLPDGIQVPVLLMNNPYMGVALLLDYFHPIQHSPFGIHPTAVIEPTAHLGKNVSIGPFVYVGHHCRLGEGVTLYPNVVLGNEVVIEEQSTLYANVSVYARCQIGKRCTLHAGVVLGADGFGYATDMKNGKHRKINQVGIVILEDDVEIGANTTIDRGAMEATRISQGTKLDNLIQIGHNVKIGQDCILVSQCGVAGSTQIGDHVLIGGQVGIAGKIGGPPIRIANGVQIAAQTGVDKSLENPDYPKPKGYWGFPQAMPIAEAQRNFIHIKKLPEYNDRLKALEQKIQELEQKLSGLS